MARQINIRTYNIEAKKDFWKYEIICELISMVHLNSLILVGSGLDFGLVWLRFGSWCLTPLSTIFQLYRGSHFFFLVGETREPRENHRPVVSR